MPLNGRDFPQLPGSRSDTRRHERSPTDSGAGSRRIITLQTLTSTPKHSLQRVALRRIQAEDGFVHSSRRRRAQTRCRRNCDSDGSCHGGRSRSTHIGIAAITAADQTHRACEDERVPRKSRNDDYLRRHPRSSLVSTSQQLSPRASGAAMSIKRSALQTRQTRQRAEFLLRCSGPEKGKITLSEAASRFCSRALATTTR